MSERILRLPVVEDRTGKGKSSIYEGGKQGTFPRPIKLGPRASGWLESEIDEWIAQRIRETRGSEQEDEGV